MTIVLHALSRNVGALNLILFFCLTNSEEEVEEYEEGGDEEEQGHLEYVLDDVTRNLALELAFEWRHEYFQVTS